MSITKNTRLKFETTVSTLTTKLRKRGGACAGIRGTPINKGREHIYYDFGETQKIKLTRKPRRRSTIADEMRLFVVSVASVASSRQKAGNASDALPKDGLKLEQVGTKKKKRKCDKCDT
jgi:hypothetical protein